MVLGPVPWGPTFLLHPVEALDPLADQQVVVAGGLHVAEVAVRGGGGEHSLERPLPAVLIYTFRQHPYVVRGQHVQNRL